MVHLERHGHVPEVFRRYGKRWAQVSDLDNWKVIVPFSERSIVEREQRK